MATLSLRTLEPADREQLAALFERLSPTSRYLRYMAPTRALPERVLRYLAAVDHEQHEAVGAFDGGDLVGAAHWFRSRHDPTCAEIAVEVADTHQRRGVAAALLGELVRRAPEAGLTRFTAEALSENRGVRLLVRHAAWPTTVRVTGPEMSIEMTLGESLRSA